MSAKATTAAPSRSFGDAMAARLRQTAIVVMGSGVAGALVGGLGSRLVMRLAALAAPEVRGTLTESGNVVGDITLEGTIVLVIFAGLSSTVFGAGPSWWHGRGSHGGPWHVGSSSGRSSWR